MEIKRKLSSENRYKQMKAEKKLYYAARDLNYTNKRVKSCNDVIKGYGYK